jgi:hypothetical protein
VIEPKSPVISIEELSIEAAKKEAEIEKEIEKEKYTPTEEQLDILEKIIMGKYNGPDEVINEIKPINPTQEDLKKLEAELIRVNEEKFGTLSEKSEEDTNQTSEIKRLNYTRRDAPLTKIQSI